MTTTNFVSGTVIDAAWLNDVNTKTYVDPYIPAGTGTIATTVQAKLRESVSVLDFGAVPGALAATNAAAFLAAWNASNPQAVLVPAGTYLFTGTVTGKFYSFGVVTISGGTVTSIVNLVP
jgi:polygalacturonase